MYPPKSRPGPRGTATLSIAKTASAAANSAGTAVLVPAKRSSRRQRRPSRDASRGASVARDTEARITTSAVVSSRFEQVDTTDRQAIIFLNGEGLPAHLRRPTLPERGRCGRRRGRPSVGRDTPVRPQRRGRRRGQRLYGR